MKEDALAAMIADLEGYIERRAREVAGPRIREAEVRAAAAEKSLTENEGRWEQRLSDVHAEWARIRTALERHGDGAVRRAAEQREQFEGLLGSVYLYVDWRYVTKQLTTPQKELFADAVDAWSARLNEEETSEEAALCTRWWRSAETEAPRRRKAV